MTPLSDRRTGRPTMADVAAEAGVSVKTVSRVVNREAGVRQATVDRVQAVIERMGFRRHDAARLLRQGRTHTIALVVEDLANPFYSQLGAAIEREARIRRYQLITASAEGSPTREKVVLESLLARRVDGVVVVPAGESPTLGPEELDPTPVVYVDRLVRSDPSLGNAATGERSQAAALSRAGGEASLAADVVLSDNAGGVRSAVEHLVAHGHRSIAFLGDDPDFWTARQRREGFLSTLAALGLPGRRRVAMGPHTRASVRQTLHDWAGEPVPPTALLTGNNRVTIATLHALRDLGARLSLVGYDDFELADLLDPPITVVHQDPAAMGQKAAQLLFARLLGDESPGQLIVMPTSLVVRGSGTPRWPSHAQAMPTSGAAHRSRLRAVRDGEDHGR